MPGIDPSKIYDVAVIGAGVVGCAIARALSLYELDCVLIEAGPDVGAGTSKANTAILHTGFDAKAGTLENGLVRRGYQLLQSYAREAGIPLEGTGGLLIAWEPDQEEVLPQIHAGAIANGVETRLLSGEEIYRLEPRLGPGARAGLHVPGESIICAFTTPLAFATQAVLNGAALALDAAVQAITTKNGIHILETQETNIRCRHLVNTAGLHSDTVNRMMGHDEFTVRPRRGELIVFDKFAAGLVDHILLPVPGKMGKGVLISPTVYGNVLLGPTAEEIGDKVATDTTAAGLASLLEKGARILPALVAEEITASYAGIRAATDSDDYQIYSHPAERYICAGGIRSTGLTASMAIAEHITGLLAEQGLALIHKTQIEAVRMPNIGERGLRPYQSASRIAVNPDYGVIVCHCEKVTRGEILGALHSPLPPVNLDGLRRRTRALMGRCQGFYCHAHVRALLAAGRREHPAEQQKTEPHGSQ